MGHQQVAVQGRELHGDKVNGKAVVMGTETTVIPWEWGR